MDDESVAINGLKLAVSACVGSQSRLTDYLGLHQRQRLGFGEDFE